MEEITIPSVTELLNSGVRFLPTKSISNISFDAKTCTFYLPTVCLDVNTKVFLKNLVAYEASVASGPLVLTRFTELMNGIIDSEEDARILREKGIIQNHLKSDKEVANLWNGMSKSLRLSREPLLDKVIEDVNKYYNCRLKVKVVKFMKSNVIGAIFLYTGLETFETNANDVSDILVTRANTVVDIVQNVITNLAAAKNLQVASFTLPSDMKNGIEVAERFSYKTDVIQSQAEETARISMEFLKAISESLIIVGTMLLLLAAVGFTDTCVAMDEWVQHPRSESALSRLLPCMDEATTQKTLDISKNTSFQVVDLVNAFVEKVANADLPPMKADKDIYYNQSGPHLPLLCNPFFPNLTERPCDADEISLRGAPTAYQSFICNTSPSGLCITMGRLTPSLYSKIMVANNLSDSLHRHGPLLARLVDCSFVIDTFDQINKDDCPSFKRYTHQTFIGLVLVSAAVMCSVILWVVFVEERRAQISSTKFKSYLN
ncbi:unnamed protein product [Sphenostylis stenocarpa]|uniref:Uncharacterized protein n=1 Tax=Sphenostylis stenocarpa TaxID=92480 RepID=A0AA86SV45_9FABA|nr:unnamed protein product [Sphenostylis stenocarpa]